MTGTETRQQKLDDLRALADFLEAHPDVPIGVDEINSVAILAGDDEAGMAELHAIANALDVEITHNASGTHHYAIRKFGSVPYKAYYVTTESMRQHVEEQKWVAERRKGVTS